MTPRLLLFLLLCTPLVGGCGALSGGRGGPKTYDQAYTSGLEAFARGDSEKALKRFMQAARRDPRRPRPHYYIGVIHAELEADDLAIVAFERAIELEPNFPEAYYNLGTLRLRRGEAVIAASLLEQSAKRNPDAADVHVNLGKAYYLSGLAPLASAAFEEALRLDPSNRAAIENLCAIARAGGDEARANEYEDRLEELNLETAVDRSE